MMKKNSEKFARFITLEGGEGAGKTTLIQQLEIVLRNRGISVLVTREPGGTSLGEQVRGLLLSQSEMKICSRAELLLFLAARAQHIEERILPALQEGKVVLCDRFNDSTVAYQGIARGLGANWVRELCNKICEGVLPDLTLYLDIDPFLGLERARGVPKNAASSGQLDRIEMEHLKFHQSIRQSFLEMARLEPERFFCIDASQTQDRVAKEAIGKVLQCVK